jgi:hypothetical protein
MRHFFPPTILDKTLDSWERSSQYCKECTSVTKQTLSPPLPQFNVVNNAETSFGNLPWHKLNIELEERGLIRSATWFIMEFIIRGLGILYRGKGNLNHYVQDCSTKQFVSWNESVEYEQTGFFLSQETTSQECSLRNLIIQHACMMKRPGLNWTHS